METRKYPLRAIKDIGRLSPDGIAVFSLSEGRIEYCNRSLLKILGIGKEEVTDVSALRRTVLDEDKFVEDQLQALKENSSIFNVELRIGPSGDRYVSCDAYYISHGDLVIATVKDITKSKQHQDYISDFGARKDVILDMVAHNLSGPLNTTANLLDRVDQMARVQQYKQIGNSTRLIRENTQRCIEIINSFLKEEHLTSKNIHVASTRFDVLAKVRLVVDSFKEFAKEKQIEIIAEPKEVMITGDDVKLFQVVHNLLSNAAKFSEAGGNISVEVVELKDTIRILVRDDGIGIPDYLHPHLFKLNTPAARPGLKGEKSIGMGLYIVKKLVELMKGRVSFESVEDEGSTFTIELPKE